MVSVAFPAWVLGLDPNKQFINISYGQQLSEKHARDTLRLMTSPAYQKVFGTRISAKRAAVNDFRTTSNGGRMATSVDGPLTGRGGDFVIVDDPVKPADAQSKTVRENTNESHDSTVPSRLNDQNKGVIIIVMQRLHQDDLVGHLLVKGNWELLSFPAIAEEDIIYKADSLFDPICYNRKVGDLLDPIRQPLKILEQLKKSLGEYAFQAQYQQNPQPAGGVIIKSAWLLHYKQNECPRQFSMRIQSWDTANKSGEFNDFSVCTTWGVLDGRYYLLDVYRRRLDYPQLRRAVIDQHRRFPCNTVLIEDKGSGIQLLQDLRREGLPLRAYAPTPGNDKEMRVHAQSAVFENGRVLLPTDAPWLTEYVRELTTFPGAKFDDQVDSTMQALDYLTSLINRGSCTVRELLI